MVDKMLEVDLLDFIGGKEFKDTDGVDQVCYSTSNCKIHFYRGVDFISNICVMKRRLFQKWGFS